ncbi:MAG: hypothetical protein SGILL_001273 [Bacillariaceae sp.]
MTEATQETTASNSDSHRNQSLDIGESDSALATSYRRHFEVEEAQHEHCEYEDDYDSITFSRRAARYLSKFDWYFPAKSNPNPPSLDAGWHHYEHVTLPRCYEQQEQQQSINKNNDKSLLGIPSGASPATSPQHYNSSQASSERRQRLLRASTSDCAAGGDRPTKLYPVLQSPLQDMADFGVSNRMYLSTLLVMAMILGAAGLLNIPLMVYFWNYADSGGNKDGVQYMGISSIRSSAICDATVWVECESCNADEYKDNFPSYRLDGTNVRRNVCNFEDFNTSGILSFAGTILLIVLAMIASQRQRKAEIVFDEAVQTASDYSIQIRNPPGDALDPEEWRQFFNRYADEGKGVAMVTIAIDNANLLKLLVQRRKGLEALSFLLPRGMDLNNRSDVTAAINESTTTMFKAFLSKLGVVKSARRLWQEIQQDEQKIRDILAQQEAQSENRYRTTSVFVTFETERSQRNALHALSTGKLDVWRQNREISEVHDDGILKVYEAMRNSALYDITESEREHVIKLSVTNSSDNDYSSALLFRDRHVLQISESYEPSDVRWIDLEASKRQRLEFYLGSSLGMAGFVLGCGCYIWRLVRSYPIYVATSFITILNSVVPVICEKIGDFESHPSEHGKQASLYFKITIFRCFNSAVVLSVISSFIETISVEDGAENLQQSLLFKVYPVIVCELFVNPVIDLMDLEGNFRKHILAPRARDQGEMNALFSGSRFWLAERYTNANRVIFVALYFASILPEALLLGAMALVAQYYAAKFILLRLSGIPPDLGFHIARLTRYWFVPFVLGSHVFMSAYWWSGYPYDNVCEDEENGGYVYCNQNLYGQRIFPPLPRFQPNGQHWMSDSQEIVTSMYAWTSVAMICLGVAAFWRNMVMPCIQGIFHSTYEPDGMDQGIDFTITKDRPEMHGYVPQVEAKEFTYPLLAADISGVDDDLIGWSDSRQGYDMNNMVHDIPHIIGGDDQSITSHPIFSIVKQYDPTDLAKRKTTESVGSFER